MQHLFAPHLKDFKFLHNPLLFTYRKDYAHWTSENISPDDINIDFEDIFDL